MRSNIFLVTRRLPFLAPRPFSSLRVRFEAAVVPKVRATAALLCPADHQWHKSSSRQRSSDEDSSRQVLMTALAMTGVFYVGMEETRKRRRQAAHCIMATPHREITMHSKDEPKLKHTDTAWKLFMRQSWFNWICGVFWLTWSTIVCVTCVGIILFQLWHFDSNRAL
ncbi:unnamed protein product [Vitrella brassicaformis CCMP3155]|uniref:Transmembrane protein n=1 Tax=Vitrella brassicaformis (strain CCMP3155) TaxID=1169540 RepID=A0A0G4FJI1_VITBC|nr:unnamed protein product [Vitrella brassicaformis CCMP3155]|eukprot:CEM13901.1 unnamed protein product [Vitrella brassicaformis CCMP3155]